MARLPLRAHETITSHFRIPSFGHLEPIFTRKILNVGFGYASGFAPTDRPNLTQIWARILGSYCFANPLTAGSGAPASMAMVAAVCWREYLVTTGLLAWGTVNHLISPPDSGSVPGADRSPLPISPAHTHNGAPGWPNLRTMRRSALLARCTLAWRTAKSGD